MTEPLLEDQDGSFGGRRGAGAGPAARPGGVRTRPGPGGRPPRLRPRSWSSGPTVPLVLDADALVAFDDDAAALSGRDDREIMITPHPGEMARLIGVSVEEVQANRLEVARRVRDRAPRATSS